MRAGLLTETIKILKPVIVETKYSGNSTEYQEYITTKASVRHISGKRDVSAGEILNVSIVRFIIRIYHKVSPDMIVVHDGVKYHILDINPENSKQSITITAEVLNE
jgi:SPP1 family predicted phage head-tail adaptor